MMGIESGQAARHDGGGPRGHPRPPRSDEPVTRADRLVHPQRRAAPAAALHPPAVRGGGGRPGLAVGPARRGPVRLLAALDRRDHRAGGFDILGVALAGHGGAGRGVRHTVDRRDWRLVGPMHIAETKEQAYEDVRVRPRPTGSTTSGGSPPSRWRPRPTTRSSWPTPSTPPGFAVIGTPDDAIAQIERLAKQSGGFGAFLLMAHEWADPEATLTRYELMARYVMPRFQGSSDRTAVSRDWAAENRPDVHRRGDERGHDRRPEAPRGARGRPGRIDEHSR